MSKKRRRAASRPKRPAASTPRPESKPQAAEPPAPVRGRAARTRDRSGASSSRAADRARAVADIPKQPPLLPSLARGLFAVGTSPSLLVTAFLGVLMMWAIYAGLGIAGLTPPGLMAQLEAVPPLHSGIDANMFQVSTRFFSPATAIAIAVVLLVVRSALLSLLLSLIDSRFQGGGTGWDDLRASARRASRSIQLVLAIEAAFLVMMIILPVVLGPLLGPIGFAVIFIAPTYFLIYAPVVAVSEGQGLLESLRIAFRASRLRGPQHVILVFGYVMVTLLLYFSTIGSPATPVTPTLVVWAYALFINFVHVAILAAVAYRWLTIRDEVLAWAPRRPAPQARGRRPAGLR